MNNQTDTLSLSKIYNTNDVNTGTSHDTSYSSLPSKSSIQPDENQSIDTGDYDSKEVKVEKILII